jgi:hypothetical protein
MSPRALGNTAAALTSAAVALPHSQSDIYKQACDSIRLNETPAMDFDMHMTDFYIQSFERYVSTQGVFLCWLGQRFAVIKLYRITI